MKNEDYLQKTIADIMERRETVLDEFFKAFIASKAEYFNKKGEVDFSRIELVEKREENGQITRFSLHLKPGKSKRINVVKFNN